MRNTPIQWTHSTINPLMGCKPAHRLNLSPAARNKLTGLKKFPCASGRRHPVRNPPRAGLIAWEKQPKKPMNMIIDRKRYDTNLASKIASRWNGCSRSDSHFVEESLYRTGKGTWFIHAAGGSESKYASISEDGAKTNYNETIVPVSEDEAADWLALHHPGLFEEYFSHVAIDA